MVALPRYVREQMTSNRLIGLKRIRSSRPSPLNRCWKLNSIITLWELPLNNICKLRNSSRPSNQQILISFRTKSPKILVGSRVRSRCGTVGFPKYMRGYSSGRQENKTKICRYRVKGPPRYGGPFSLPLIGT